MHELCGIILQRIGLTGHIIIYKQAPGIILLVGIGQRDTCSPLKGVVGIQRKVIPFGIVGLICLVEKIGIIIQDGHGVDIHHLTLVMGREIQLLHDATTGQQLGAHSKTLREWQIEIHTKVGSELCQVVALNRKLRLFISCSEDDIIQWSQVHVGIKILKHLLHILVGIVQHAVPAIDRCAIHTQTTTHTNILIEEIGTLGRYGSRSTKLQVKVVVGITHGLRTEVE